MEERIYLEAELMYKKLNDFKTIQGNLRKWVGHLKTRNNESITINIEIPRNFPIQPPIIKISPPIVHSSINRNGNLTLKMLNNWKPEYHIFQIINSLKALFWKEPPKRLFKVEIKQEKTPTKKIKKPKKSKIKINDSVNKIDISREAMEKKIQIQFSLDFFSPILKDKVLELQSEKIAVINLVESLDENFQKGEISAEIYSKLYRKYYNFLILINEKLKKMTQEN
ncbi:MAG: ubiquitin-conjugating enzyme E2 [Candidatus Hodarchaeota archaeon]